MAEFFEDNVNYCDLSEGLSNILWFEPYRTISVSIIRELFDERQSEDIVSQQHLEQLAKGFEGRDELLQRILMVNHKAVYLEENKNRHSDVIMQMWSQQPRQQTYRVLRETFDRYSIFGGRNPLDAVVSYYNT